MYYLKISFAPIYNPIDWRRSYKTASRSMPRKTYVYSNLFSREESTKCSSILL